MRLKVLLIAILAVAIGFFAIDANAQWGGQPQQDGLSGFALINIYAGYITRDKQNQMYNGVYSTAQKALNGTKKADTDFYLETPGTGASKAGLIFNKGSLQVKGAVAYCSNNPDASKLDIKEMFLNYKFSNGMELLAGRNQTPYTAESYAPRIDVMDANGLAHEGASFDSWAQQILVRFMGAYAEIIQPAFGPSTPGKGNNVNNNFSSQYRGGSVGSTAYTTVSGSTANSNAGIAGNYSYMDALIPKIAIGYLMPGPIRVGAHFVYQQIKVNNNAYAYNGAKITSYSGNATANIDTQILYIHGNVFYSQNQGDMGFFSNETMCAQVDTTNGKKLVNTKGYGGNAGLAYKTPLLIPSVGFGYTHFKTDNPGWKADAAYSITACLTINIDPTTTITPGFKYNNYLKDVGGVKEGSQKWIGVEFQAFYM